MVFIFGADLMIFVEQFNELLLYPGGIPRREPPSCEAPRQPTIYMSPDSHMKQIWERFNINLELKNHTILLGVSKDNNKNHETLNTMILAIKKIIF